MTGYYLAEIAKARQADLLREGELRRRARAARTARVAAPGRSAGAHRPPWPTGRLARTLVRARRRLA
ncbi:MAG: hypothetical protein ACJ74O_13770 [Frankiaceae bacterium]